MSEGEPKDYDIFNNFYILETIRNEMELKYEQTDNSSFCDEINFLTNNENQIRNFCKMFVALFNASIRQCRTENKQLKEKKYPEFINYLINHKLSEAAYRKKEKDNFYTEMTSKYSVLNKNGELKNRMYVINDKYLINLNILYKLYNNYDKLSQEKVKHCKDILEEMKYQYNYGLEKCFYDGNIKFYLILESSSHDERLKIAKIGNSLIRSAYTPSLERSSQVYTENYFNLKYLIFLQYNLHMEMNEEDTMCAMMKIIYQFIQYCNQNRDNLKLLPFMKEFIKEYYNKKNTKYETIFNECKSSGNTKEYCKLYKKCSKEFIEDLTMIEKDASNYIKKQENYINSLSPLDRFILEAKDMFQDFKKMSKYSPTIMSTMVAIVVCLFFLYKLTPLNSIFCKGKKKRKRIPLFFPERINDLKDDNTGHKNVTPKRGKIRFSYQPT
ncbi:PIR protein [Plasmodium vivax]|uniref:VIR protein n=1 Tax=Plasmodium vivax TaxID=5855 RepID=A0A565A5F4_PLAVI|nr:PIR protein [Plasmodium vivax]